MNNPLYGLVLVGGESRRMGRDKALLSYNGKETQLEKTASALQTVCEKTFVSLRHEQDYKLPAQATPIYDSIQETKGPLCGILSAMHAHPNADWLVVACDLPYLNTETLQKLINEYQRQPGELTAYKSTHDGLPEPLCAIYPSGKDQELLELAHQLGKFCPRKLLIQKQARLIQQDDPRSLENINTSEEYEAIRLNK